MVPLSQWKRASRPPSPQYIASGQGARINVGSTDHSVQQFQNQTAEFRAVERELDALRAAIEQLHCSNDRQNALIDVEQISMELRRPKPEPSRVWTLVDRLTAVGGLAERAASLGPLLRRLFESWG